MISIQLSKDLYLSKLSVAKVCHEMANHLSVIKFIQDDISGLDLPELRELFNSLDLLSLTMEFFRDMYSSSDASCSLFKILSIKNIALPSHFRERIRDFPINLKNVICGILYIIMKISKPNDLIEVLECEPSTIIISVPKSRTLPPETYKVFSKQYVDSTEPVENAINVFGCYINSIAFIEGFKISMEDESQNQKVKLCKS